MRQFNQAVDLCQAEIAQVFVEVTRVTLANTLLGMLGLVAFSAVLSESVELLPSNFAFWLSLFSSLFVSTFLWFFSRWDNKCRFIYKS